MSLDTAALSARFREVVTSEAEVRAVTGAAHQRALDKVVRVIDDMSRRFIAAAPFVFIASAAEDGTADVSPKGDPRRLRQGAGRAHPRHPRPPRQPPLRHLPQHPAQPGGRPDLPDPRRRLHAPDQRHRDHRPRRRPARGSSRSTASSPTTCWWSAVSRVLSHCPKCMIRSGLWKPEDWPDTGDVPELRRDAGRPRRDQRAGRGGRSLDSRRGTANGSTEPSAAA